jgi:hypothetical protein
MIYHCGIAGDHEDEYDEIEASSPESAAIKFAEKVSEEIGYCPEHCFVQHDGHKRTFALKEKRIFIASGVARALS